MPTIIGTIPLTCINLRVLLAVTPWNEDALAIRTSYYRVLIVQRQARDGLPWCVSLPD